MDGSERRKNYYINKEFQTIFILKFCLLVLIGSLISGAIVYGMSRSAVTTTFENSKLTIKSAADYILPAVLLASAVVTLAIGLAAIAVTLFTSHRIAGPLYRIEKDINQITAGNLKIIFNLRQKDEIKPIANSLNLMAGSLREKILAIRQDLDKIDSEIAKSPGVVPEIIKDRVRHAKEAVNKFTA